MKWERIRNTVWRSDHGHTVIKYRMAQGVIEYLLYAPGEPREGGDYSSHGKLADAKNAALTGETA